MSLTRSCSICKSASNLEVWAIPDPYNGYPLSPQMICGSCPKPTNIWYEKWSDYSPRDDYVLGLRSKPLSFTWVYCSGSKDQKCAHCAVEIGDGECGHRWIDGPRGSRGSEEFFCVPCCNELMKHE